MRTPALLAAAVVVALSAPAGATPYCELLKPTAANDQPTPGSAAWQETLLPGSTGTYRLASADIASDAQYVTIVWRPRSLDSTDPTAPLYGRIFHFNFSTSASDHYYADVTVSRSGDVTGRLGWMSVPYRSPGDPQPSEPARVVQTRHVANLDARIDPDGDIRTGIPVAALGGLPAGTVLEHFGAASYVDYADNWAMPRDWLHGYGATYPAGAASCVTPWTPPA